MRRPVMPRSRPAWLLAVTMVSFVITLGALWAFGIDLKGGAAHLEDTQEPIGRWRAEKRDRLAVCIDTVNVAVAAADQAKAETEQVLTELENDPIWQQFNKGFPAPLVDIGCPSPPALYDPDSHRPSPFPDTFAYLQGRVVTDASYYRLHIYVIPKEDIDRYGSDWRFTTEETFCEYDSCESATVGLYLSTKDLDDRPLLMDLVAKAIGLRGTGR